MFLKLRDYENSPRAADEVRPLLTSTTTALLINNNDIPTLLRNDGGNTNNWLVIRTEAVPSNRAGIGARGAVTVAGNRRILDVRGSKSYLSGNDLVHFGMGDHPRTDVGEIR
jgi:hypothetical protein